MENKRSLFHSLRLEKIAKDFVKRDRFKRGGLSKAN